MPADHPHARGENGYTGREQELHRGPSPRAWGEPVARAVWDAWMRTIPTRVGRTSSTTRHRGARTDHPHARGENVIIVFIFSVVSGPSPRAWGELPEDSVIDHAGRTIPTRVGRTSGRLPICSQITDHPHARGENDVGNRGGQERHGPSPRAWGELSASRVASAAVRTIPTRVGRTTWEIVAAKRDTDHPHARGENWILFQHSSRRGGPSPRAWGEHIRCAGIHNDRRTIPTRVGRTPGYRFLTGGYPDHPHARGENEMSFCFCVFVFGPSPRAWGELHSTRYRSRCSRTIPTRVGRTGSGKTLIGAMADHPHARGENEASILLTPCTLGPSPRAWGERRGGCPHRVKRRTIPTRVGRTRPPPSRRHHTSDHPHARGENPAYRSSEVMWFGPSPRAWGEHLLPSLVLGRFRTIPTRVGRTRRMSSRLICVPDHPHARGENRPRRTDERALRGPSPRAWGERACA